MSKKHQFREETLTQEHIAVRAWQQLDISPSFPSSVELLTRANGRPLNRKSRIYRLRGVELPGGSVIGKRACRETIEKEIGIYRQILPSMPFSSPHFYGSIDEEGGDFSWLFLDEVVGRRFNEQKLNHRLLAARWLAQLHSISATMNCKSIVPPFGTVQYRRLLTTASETIENNLSNPAVSSSQRGKLRMCISQCQEIESSWRTISDACSEFPDCVTHGDFISKNVFVAKPNSTEQLFTIDWEAVCWGNPAEDLGALDWTIQDFGNDELELYVSVARKIWPHLTLRAVSQLRDIGVIFRYIAFIHATSIGLDSTWVNRTVESLELYRGRLRRAGIKLGIH